MADADTIVLDDAPSLPALYARAAAPAVGGRGATGLPDRRLARHGVQLDRDHVAAYSRVCGFTLTDALPPTYLHMLAFPLQIQLMSGGDFPFPLLGMVHLRQRIELSRAVTADESVDVLVWLEDLRPHAKGQQFTVRSQASAAGDVVWDGFSTYLHRGRTADDVVDEQHPADEVEVGALPMTARWRIDGDQGRRYGRVSGDVNPIHLSALTARPFGFPKAIAHGMWTMAHALAALEGRVPEDASIDVAFKTPLFIPGTVTFASRQADEGWQFGVRDDRSGKPHLAGIVTG